MNKVRNKTMLPQAEIRTAALLTLVHPAATVPHDVSSLLGEGIRVPARPAQVDPQVHAVKPLQRAHVLAEPGRLAVVGQRHYGGLAVFFDRLAELVGSFVFIFHSL